MASRSASKGSTDTLDRFDPDFTQNVINAIGPKASPRVRQVFGSLIRHLHEFARENEITVEEWMAAVELVNDAGRMSHGGRDELVLLSDVLGLESLVDEISHKVANETGGVSATETAIRGPFWKTGAPQKQMGESIASSIDDSDHTFVHGVVMDYRTGEPIEGVELDVWHTAPNGLYEQQDDSQVNFNLHGRFRTGHDGCYWFYCLRPTTYPIPNDGPTGKLLNLLDRHPMRPAHIHFYITASGYEPLTTQIFDRRDKHLKDDAVFAVKESLVVDFLPLSGDAKADFELPYNFKLVGSEDAKKARYPRRNTTERT